MQKIPLFGNVYYQINNFLELIEFKANSTKVTAHFIGTLGFSLLFSKLYFLHLYLTIDSILKSKYENFQKSDFFPKIK